MMRILSAAAIATVCLVPGGCRTLRYTVDGTPIVPFAADEGTGVYHSRTVELRFALEAWTDRMPGPRTGRSPQPGFPLYVALRIDVVSGGRGPAELRVPALSLWSQAGDSLLAAFALIRADGSAPLVGPADSGLTVELTNDRNRPRYSDLEPETGCTARLLIEDGGRRHYLTLPPLEIGAAY